MPCFPLDRTFLSNPVRTSSKFAYSTAAAAARRICRRRLLRLKLGKWKEGEEGDRGKPLQTICRASFIYYEGGGTEGRKGGEERKRRGRLGFSEADRQGKQSSPAIASPFFRPQNEYCTCVQHTHERMYVQRKAALTYLPPPCLVSLPKKSCER